MEWFGILFLALVVGAAVLAIYEWRKGVKLRTDPPPHDTHQQDTHQSERGAYAKAEQIRAEGAALQNPSSGHY